MSLSDPCSSFFGTPARPECHLLYGRDIVPNLWHTVATKDVRLLRCWLSQRFSLPKGYLFLQELCPRDGFTWDLDYAYLRQLGQEE